MNKAKKKFIMGNTNSKTAIFSNLNNFDKKTQLSSVLLKKQLIFNIKNIDIAMINVDTYCIACYLKRVQVFVISQKNF